MSCQTNTASNLTLSHASKAPQRQAIISAVLVHIQVLLEQNQLNLVPLMGSLCHFHYKMKHNCESDHIQPFKEEEQKTVSDFLLLWKQYSGVNIDHNEFKSVQTQISMAIHWLPESFGTDVDGELHHWTVLNEKSD